MVGNNAGQDRPMFDEAPDVQTPEETARLLRIGRNAAYEAIQRGDIPSVRIGRRILVPKLGVGFKIWAVFRSSWPGKDEGRVVHWTGGWPAASPPRRPLPDASASPPDPGGWPPRA